MLVNQAAELVNLCTAEILGESAIVANEDLSNIVDVGTQVFDTSNTETFARTLIDHIGRVQFVNRVYGGWSPNIRREAWEYGAACEKIRARMPEATENESWDLIDNQSYDPNIFHKPDVFATFYQKRICFEVENSIVEQQIKGAFSNATQMMAFIAMLQNAVDTKITICLDALVMKLIECQIVDTVKADFASSALNSKSGVKAVNLLYLYNTEFSKSLTAAEFLKDPDCLRYAAQKINLYRDRLKAISTLFNIDGEARFTPEDQLHVVLHTEFISALDTYLASDTFHKELVSVNGGKLERIPYWQGTGTSYAIADTMNVDVKTPAGNYYSGGVPYVIGCLFDNDALMVSCLDRRTDTQRNPKGNFINYFHKAFMGLGVASDENFVTFFLA